MISTDTTESSYGNNHMSSLSFLRPEVAALKLKLDAFVLEECIPVEQSYEEHISQFHGTDRWNRQAIPPCIEELKLRAKQLGLFNLFLPHHLRPKIPIECSGRSGQNDTTIGSSGGSGSIIPALTLSYREYGIFCETMGRSTPISSEVCNCNAPDTGNMEVLLEFGTRVQQQQYLIPLLHGTIRSTFLMTEPAVASSDPTNLQTKLTKIAIRSNNPTAGTFSSSSISTNDVIRYEYILSGTKWWSTGAMDPRCACALVVAKMDYTHPSLMGTPYYDQPNHPQQQQQFPSNKSGSSSFKAKQRRHNAHTIVIVPMPHPNVHVVRPLTVFGYDDAPHGHAEVQLKDVHLTSESLLLGESFGFRISQARLGPGRIHHCMRAIGIASRCYELMIQRSLDRQTFGKYLWEHGGVQEMIADSYADIEAARLLTLSCADTMDRIGVKASRQQIAMIKVAVPKLTYNVIDRAIQIYGGAGVGNDTILARSLVGIRTLRIADGPDAVHQRTIARLEIQNAKNNNNTEKKIQSLPRKSYL